MTCGRVCVFLFGISLLPHHFDAIISFKPTIFFIRRSPSICHIKGLRLYVFILRGSLFCYHNLFGGIIADFYGIYAYSGHVNA